MRNWNIAQKDFYQKISDDATEMARAYLRPGDKICSNICCGHKRWFIFTHWEGKWICGKNVSDCHALHIYKINGRPHSFAAGSWRQQIERLGNDITPTS